MSDPAGASNQRIDSTSSFHSYELTTNPPHAVEKLSINSLSSSEVPFSSDPDPKKIIFIALGILAVIGGVFLAYKTQQSTLPPIQKNHFTGKIRTTVTYQ